MFPLLVAQADAGMLGAVVSMAPFILVFVIMYFLILRPQKKKEKELQKMLTAMKKGDSVISIGGIHGKVKSVEGDKVIVEVDKNTSLKFNRQAIATVLPKDKEDDKISLDKKEEKIEDKPTEISEENK